MAWMEITLKLNVKKLLEQLAQSQSSGCLELNEEFVSWKIYLQEKFKYVYCSIAIEAKQSTSQVGSFLKQNDRQFGCWQSKRSPKPKKLLTPYSGFQLSKTQF